LGSSRRATYAQLPDIRRGALRIISLALPSNEPLLQVW